MQFIENFLFLFFGGKIFNKNLAIDIIIVLYMFYYAFVSFVRYGAPFNYISVGFCLLLVCYILLQRSQKIVINKTIMLIIESMIILYLLLSFGYGLYKIF